MADYFSANSVYGAKALWNVVLSERSDGKTFDFKYRALKNTLKTGGYRIYVRRWKTEFDYETKAKFFDEVFQKKEKEFSNIVDTKLVGNSLYIKVGDKWKLCVIFMPLTMSGKRKSSFNPLPVDEICFDEYVPLDGRYAPNEMVLLFEFWNTCDRQRNKVKMLILGNKVECRPPVFDFFNVNIDINQPKLKTYKNGRLAVLIYRNKTRHEATVEGAFMDLVRDTAYGDYLEGGVLSFFKPRIMKCPQDAEYWASFISNIGEGSIWIYQDKWYITERQRKDGILIGDTIYDKDNREHYSILTGGLPKFFKDLAYKNKIYSDSDKAWNMIQPLLEKINIQL